MAQICTSALAGVARSLQLAAGLGLAGCGEPGLEIEPPAIDLLIDLVAPPPSASLRVLRGGSDQTAAATFAIAGAPLGTLAGGQFSSDGRTGGAATITVTVGADAATVPVTVAVRARRVVPGAPAGAADLFALATPAGAEIALAPGDGAVLPPNLGRLDVDFAAADGDDAHEVAFTGPYLDLRIDAPGVPGPRHVELLAAESEAIAKTLRGAGVDLAVASLATAAPKTARVGRAHLAIADLEVRSLLFGGLATAAGQPYGATGAEPALWRYDMHDAQSELWLADPNGGCIGCHAAVSPDGARIVAGNANAAGPHGLGGTIIDVQERAAVALSTATWDTATYDPSGALVTTSDGAVDVRDPSSGASLAQPPIPARAASPTVAPDGKSIAYLALDPLTPDWIGNALRVQPWDAATATVGPPVDLDAAPGIEAPAFSPDGRWLAYSRTVGITRPVVPAGIDAVRADGSAPPIRLTDDNRDYLVRWASPVSLARVDGRAPEPMAWLAFVSTRDVGARAQPIPQLWLAAFFPSRGVASQPLHLPAQPPELRVIHAPTPF